MDKPRYDLVTTDKEPTIEPYSYGCIDWTGPAAKEALKGCRKYIETMEELNQGRRRYEGIHAILLCVGIWVLVALFMRI